MQSPPARAMADYLLKDHKPSLSAWKPLQGWRVRHPSLCQFKGRQNIWAKTRFLALQWAICYSVRPCSPHWQGRVPNLPTMAFWCCRKCASHIFSVRPWTYAGGRRVDPARRACPTSARAYGDWEINPVCALAVGLKPSARQGKARLRGLYRNNYSKTIISA